MPNVPSLPERHERFAQEMTARVLAAIAALPYVQRTEVESLLKTNEQFAKAINATVVTQQALNRATEPGYVINLMAIRNRRMALLPDAG